MFQCCPIISRLNAESQWLFIGTYCISASLFKALSLYDNLIMFQGKVESTRTHLSTELGEEDFSKAGQGFCV